jgi:hypothetical protein
MRSTNMIAGDLVRYVSDGDPDDVIGVVVKMKRSRFDDTADVHVLWSLETGPHYDECPEKSLEVISETW